MDVTFTSGDKRMIKSMVDYFFNAHLTSDNMNRHIQHLGDKYKGVTIKKKVVNEKSSNGTTNMCIKLKSKKHIT